MTITIYTSHGCGPCMATKDWLNKQGHAYTEKDVSQHAEYATELRSLGYRVTPVIMVGDEAVVGFNTIRLKELLS